MKKPTEYYKNFRVYEDRDSWIRNWSSKIVKTRKKHHCFMCDKDIPKGSEMLLETAIDPDIGRVSSYTCGECVDEHVEEIKGGSMKIITDYEVEGGI
jgi:hypothetical protein